jgi:hypothetical protein
MNRRFRDRTGCADLQIGRRRRLGLLVKWLPFRLLGSGVIIVNSLVLVIGVCWYRIPGKPIPIQTFVE